MNYFLITNYIKKLTKDDIVNFSKKQNITLTPNEVDIIYYYIKNYYRDFFNGKDKELLLSIKDKVSNNTYQKILEYYKFYQNK